jgi:hypothetical protein
MKFSKPVSILGLLAVACSSILSGTAAQAAPSSAGSPESSITAADRMTGPFAMHSNNSTWSFHGFKPGADGTVIASTIGWAGVAREEAISGAAVANYPAPGASGPIRIGTQCLGGDPTSLRREVRLYDCAAAEVRQFTTTPTGQFRSGDVVISAAYPGMDDGPGWLTLVAPSPSHEFQLDLLAQVPDVAPSASVGSPTLYPGQSVDVEATFNADAGGQRIDIDAPAGTKVTAVANAAFSLSDTGATGTLPAGVRSVTFTLTADADAPIGSATGGQISWYLSKIKLADLTATIVAAPVPPSVTIPNQTVKQGASVDVPVAFNAAASGYAEIILPQGLEPAGDAPAGFTWYGSINGYGGTLSDANRSFVMKLKAKADAAVGSFDGVVRGQDLNQRWSVTIEAGVPVPDAPLVLESPVWGGSLVPGAPVFSGSGQAGAKVEVVTAWQDRVGDTIVKQDGSWSITWNKALVPGHYVGGSVIQTVEGKAPTRVPYDFFVVRDEVAPLTVTSPRIGQTISDSVPTFTGTAQPGARVVIVGVSGDELGRVDEVAASGSWTITWDKSLLPNRYVGGTVKQYVGGVERGSFTYDFTIVLPKLVVSSPKVGDTIVGTRPTFTGRANPGAEIEITGLWGTPLGKRQADANGDWSITWPKDYAPGPYAGGKVTETVNGKLLRTFVYDFTLVR